MQGLLLEKMHLLENGRYETVERWGGKKRGEKLKRGGGKHLPVGRQLF